MNIIDKIFTHMHEHMNAEVREKGNSFNYTPDTGAGVELLSGVYKGMSFEVTRDTLTGHYEGYLEDGGDKIPVIKHDAELIFQDYFATQDTPEKNTLH